MSNAEIRRAFAENVAEAAGTQNKNLIAAFATVRREAYLGPGPWKIYDVGRGNDYRDTPDDDPVHVYENACIAIDPARNLNNGEPGLHMELLDVLSPAPGDHVVHVGTGTGYYTAILAELVGAGGRVTAIEYDEDLARRSRDNLADYGQVTVVCADGTRFDTGPADGIYVCAGVTAPSATWLDNLRPNGRLIVALTTATWHGHFFEFRRTGATFAARFLRPCGIIPCMSTRDGASETLLAAAFEQGDFAAVRSLRRAPHPRDPSCWLHGEAFCLSRNPV